MILINKKKPDNVNLLRPRIVMEAELGGEDRPRRSILYKLGLVLALVLGALMVLVFMVVMVLEVSMALV